jgi:hypothetical protein
MQEPSRTAKKRIARWRKRVITAWQKQARDVIATGKLLIEAHDDLIDVHGAWANMIENDLPFDRTTAHRLMAIARHKVLSSVAHVQHLPAHWGTMYELSKIDPDTLLALIKNGEVTARTQRQDVERLRRTTAAGRVSPPLVTTRTWRTR